MRRRAFRGVSSPCVFPVVAPWLPVPGGPARTRPRCGRVPGSGGRGSGDCIPAGHDSEQGGVQHVP